MIHHYLSMNLIEFVPLVIAKMCLCLSKKDSHIPYFEIFYRCLSLFVILICSAASAEEGLLEEFPPMVPTARSREDEHPSSVSVPSGGHGSIGP